METMANSASVGTSDRKLHDELLFKSTGNTTAYALGLVLRSLGEDDNSWHVETTADGFIRLSLDYKR